MRILQRERHEPDVTLAFASNAQTVERVVVPEIKAIFVDHAPYVLRLARRLGVRDGDVDDICQEVFVTVHRRLPTYEGRGSMRSFVYGICVRAVANYRRKAHRRYEIGMDSPPEDESYDDPSRELERKSALAALDRALDALSEDHRTVFVLYEIEELSMNEVADVVGCPLKTAYSRLYAARGAVEGAMRAERSRA
jgi:RNA polymerase sigma-70 factor (ECF subfamily)